MPKRSNEFQRLVYALTLLRADGAEVVVESAELPDLATGEKREVDVVSIGKFSGHDSMACIESRDWKRKQDVQWIEQAKTKFDSLGANVKVLVSKSGFTEPALTKAKQFGIQAITPGELTPNFVGHLVGTDLRWLMVNKDVIATRFEVEVESPFDGQPYSNAITANRPLFRKDGSEAGTADSLANTVLVARVSNDPEDWPQEPGGEEAKTGRLELRDGEIPDGPLYLIVWDRENNEALAQIRRVAIDYLLTIRSVDEAFSHGEYSARYRLRAHSCDHCKQVDHRLEYICVTRTGPRGQIRSRRSRLIVLSY